MNFTNGQQAEPDHTFHGEFLDALDDASVAFELEDARRMAAASALTQREHGREGAKAPPHDFREEAQQRKNFVIHQTCASAYALLLQRRGTSLREVSLPICYARASIRCWEQARHPCVLC
jgi:hypothetical protein